ncbi:Vacuolar protein sorting-associated protein 13B [Schistosoma japonicum]|nr:Vacuolar protein sorting-associated protein 13B [Schistosoma japonicum]
MQRYFKLETYVGKLLMSYLNKYIKLRDDQFAMSIWDGDLILTQLDLRLDFLEDIIPLPVNFRSGRVHELRIHVPWTKLNSEHIIITLNTVECIFGLKKPDTNKAEQNIQNPANVMDLYGCKNQSMPANVSPGYLEGFIYRLLSNIHFVVHNLNLKFMVEDLVLSLSLNKGDCFVTDFSGNPTFADINPRSTYVVNRLAQFFDLTICLDRAGPNGYVEVYEDPIAFRFNMSCFIQIICTPSAKCLTIHQTLLTNLKIHCETLVAHIGPVQIPLLCRLIQIFLNVSTETFDWSIFNYSDSNTKSKVGDKEDFNLKAEEPNSKSDISDIKNQSWASWVWSFVPSIIPVTEDSDTSDNDYDSCGSKEKYQDVECVKELIQCILEDASENSLVAPMAAIHNSSESPELISTVNSNQKPHLSDPPVDTVNNSGTNTYLHSRRRKIRHLRRSVSLVPVVVIGIFIDKIDLNISLPCPKGFTCSSSNSGVRSRRIKHQFQHSGPVIKCEFTDVAFQTTTRDIYFSLIQFGIRGLSCYPMGCICCCGQSEYSPFTKHDSPYSPSLNKSISIMPDTSQCSTTNVCSMFDNLSCKTRPNFLSLGCHTNFTSSASELCSYPYEIFYSAILQQLNSQSNKYPKTTQESSKLICSLILTLNDYNKYLTDKNIREKYPAFWFDSVYSINLNEPHLTTSDVSSVRRHQLDGVQTYIHNRFLIGSYSIDVSPNIIHRLEGLVIAYKSSNPYPSCSLPVEALDEMSSSLSSNLSLSRFSQHISTRYTRVDIDTGVLSIHPTHNFYMRNLLPCLQLRLDRISLYNRSPIYPYDLVHTINRQTIPSYLFKRSYDFIQLELRNPLKSVDDWLHELHSGVPNMPSKEWNKQLIAYCYNRTIIKLTGIYLNLIVNRQTNQSCDIHLSDNSDIHVIDDLINNKLSILKLVNFECVFWSLNYPHLWNSPSISCLEYRFKLENVVEVNLSLQSVGILSFILSDMFHQLHHFIAYCHSQDKNICWPTEHQYCLQNNSQLNDKKCWIWSTKLNGFSKFRLCYTKLVSVIQISLETNVLMYLNCPNELKICPMMLRIADKSDNVESKVKPFFCLAAQLPYSHDSFNTPTTCHAYLTNFDCLITPELFEWFASLSLPDINTSQAQSCCKHEYTSSPIESSSGIEISNPTKKKHVLSYDESLSSSDTTSKYMMKANIIKSSLSTYSSITLPTRSLVIGNIAQWKEVWKRLTHCENILRNAKVQILCKPARIFAIINECPPTFFTFLEDDNSLKIEHLLTQSEISYLLFGFPQLHLSNYYGSDNVGDDEFEQTQFDDTVLSNCSWSCGLYDLPMFLPTENIGTSHYNFNWMFSAVKTYLIMENSLIFSGQFSVNLDFLHNQDSTSNVSISTLSSNTICDNTNPIVINLHIIVQCNRESDLPNVSNRIPDFQILKRTVKTIQFCYNGVFGMIVPKFFEFTTFMHNIAHRTLSSGIINRSIEYPYLKYNIQSRPVHVNLSNSTCIIDKACVEVPTVTGKTYCSPYSKMKSSSINSYPSRLRNSDIRNSSVSKCQDIPLDMTLHVQCNLLSTSGQIMLARYRQDVNKHIVLQWTMENAEISFDLKTESCCVDFHIRHFEAVIQKTPKSMIPLFTLLEKDIQPIQLLQPYPNKTHDSEIETQTISSPNLSTNRHDHYDKSSWFEENYIPFIPINARKRHRLDSNQGRVENKSIIGENFIRIVFRRTYSKSSATSDYISASQSDLSSIDDTSLHRDSHPENNLHIGIQPLDIVIIPEVIDEISDFINDCLTYEGQYTVSSSNLFTAYAKKTNMVPAKPIFSVHSFPVIGAEIESFRLFYLLGGMFEDKNTEKHPNAVMLSCDLIQAKPLLENFIDRSYFANDFTTSQSSPVMQPSIVNDKQYIVTANCINIAAVPFSYICHMKQDIDYNPCSSSSAIAQNPAKDWNRAATYSDINDSLWGWSIVHSFSASITFAPALIMNENSVINIYGGYSMELSLINNLLILADCELIKHLVRLTHSPNSYSSNISQLSHQSSFLKLFERLFFADDSNRILCTPSRLFMTAHQILLLMWIPSDNKLNPAEVNCLSEFTIQINQPYIIINLAGGNVNTSDRLELSINSFQMDCREGELKSSCTLCEPVIINKFIQGKCNRKSTVIIVPCKVGKKTQCNDKADHAPTCSSLLFWYSGFSVKHSPSNIMKPCLLITCTRSSVFDYSSVVKEPISHQYNRFKVHISTAQDQFLCLRPDTISALFKFCKFFHQLFGANYEDNTSRINAYNDNENNKFIANNESGQRPGFSTVHQSLPLTSIARLIHALHFYFDRFNIEINCIKISLRFHDSTESIINSSNVLELRMKQILTFIQLNHVHSELLATTFCWQNLSSLSLICYTIKSNFTSSNTNSLRCGMNFHRPVYLIWPNTSINVGLFISTKHCSHNSSINPNYWFDKVYVHLQTESGLCLHLPIHGYINDYIMMIITKTIYIIRSSEISNLNCSKSTEATTSIQCTSQSDNLCVHCSNYDPTIHTDSLRSQDNYVFHSYSPMSTLQSSLPNQMIAMTCSEHGSTEQQLELLFSHPYWPWILNQNIWKQSPLQTHPWPSLNEVISYNDLSNDKDNNIENECLQKPYWLSVTWMYNELRSPTYLKVLPVPFEIITSGLNSTYSPNGFELQCYLQYWDPFYQYGGSFMTYSTFILSDSQITQYVLPKYCHQGHHSSVPTTPTSLKPESNHTSKSTHNGQVDISVLSRSSSSNAVCPDCDDFVHQPAAAIWRILVDLRVRSGSNTSNPSVNENHPVALAGISPMILIGAVRLDTVHYSNSHAVDQCCILRCQTSNVTISLIEHQSMECQNIGGFELCRFSLKDIDFIYKSNLSSFKSTNYPCVENHQFEIGQFSLLTADVNWARLQQCVINNNLLCRLSNQELDILCKHLNIFVSSDRLVSLVALNKRIQQYISEFSNVLFCSNTLYHEKRQPCSSNRTPDTHSTLGWMLINYSNQSIVLDQLPLIKYLSITKTNKSHLEAVDSVIKLFRLSLKPRQSTLWRPIVFPGPVSSSGHAFRVKLRIGITLNNGDNTAFLWSHPVELPWPLSFHKQHSDILCALSLKWKETSLCAIRGADDDVHYPELYLLVCSAEPSGSPGKIILHSNMVVRNLLPVPLSCSLNTSTTDIPEKTSSISTITVNKDLSNISNQHQIISEHAQPSEQFFQMSIGPFVEFISTCANPKRLYKTTLGRNLCIAFKVYDNSYSDDHMNKNNLWSDKLTFKIPLPDQLNSQTETSHRTLISLPLNNEKNSSTGPCKFYAIVTVEYYTTRFTTPPICIITISPLFEILNCMPICLTLVSKAISPQQTMNANSLSIETISPAILNHEKWLKCQHDKSIPDLSNSYLRMLAKPIRLAYHYDLLLTGTLPNGESVFSHPVRLSGHEILKKLATTHLKYNNFILKHNNPDDILSTKSTLQNNSLPIISTLGIIPKFSFVSNSVSDYLDYLHNNNEDKLVNSIYLQYSLRLVLRSQLLLINFTGINIQLRLSSQNNNSSSNINSCDILLKDNESLPLSKTHRCFQLGVVSNDEIFWSEIITIDLYLAELLDDHQNSTGDNHLNAFLWNSQPKCLSLSNSYTTYTTILVKDKLLCLTIQLKSNNPVKEDIVLTGSNNFIITIQPRFYIKHWLIDCIPLRFKPIVIPIESSISEVIRGPFIPTSLSGSNEVIEISEENNSIPILWWHLSHIISKPLLSTELLYCMQISVDGSSAQSHWSQVFPLHRIPCVAHNAIHRNEFSSVPIFLNQVSLPVVSENSNINIYPTLLITTIKHKFAGEITIQVNKTTILQNLNPFSIHIHNCTSSSIYSIELLDSLSSSSSLRQGHLSSGKLLNDLLKITLKNSLLDWYPHKIYPHSQLSIIPQSLVELLYIDTLNRSCDKNSNAELCLNFFNPSHFSVLELNLCVQSKDIDDNHVKSPVNINLKELYSTVDVSKILVTSNGLWHEQKVINNHLIIELCFSMCETSFGLIVQLIDADLVSCRNWSPIANQLVSSTRLKYLNKIHLTINEFCMHLITIENHTTRSHYYQKKKSLVSSALSSKHKLYELLPPQDEFIRLTTLNLRIILVENSSLISRTIQLYDKNFIVNRRFIIEILLQHFQLDNWCHAWTNAYDFPVIAQTFQLRKPKTVCQISLTSSSPALLDDTLLNTLSTSFPVFTLHLYPPNLDVYLEDSLIYDLVGEFSNLVQIINGFSSSCRDLNISSSSSSSSKPIDQACIIFKQFTVDSFKINLSLHAMLRLYLSCHSAPLNFSTFRLINVENTNYSDNQHNWDILSGSLMYYSSVKHLLTMHYFTQMLFRSGWLVGSLDLLGNVTGLLYSLVNGLNDLIHLRSSNDNEDDDDQDSVKIISLSETNLPLCKEYVDLPSMTTMGAVASLKYNRNVGFLFRLTQGLRSLTRRTTGTRVYLIM